VTVVDSCNDVYLYTLKWMTVTEISDLDALDVVSVACFVCM